jgi:hypothetical protein|tara:strand:- start:458 stop:715 length:258 start_codon:yes stop_codon:yes gene_type:complete
MTEKNRFPINVANFRAGLAPDDLSQTLGEAVIGFIDENPDEGIIYNIDKIINLLMDEGISRKCAVEILDNDLRKVDPLNVFLWPN